MSNIHEIPKISPFQNFFGMPGTSYAKTEQIQNLALLDRLVYAGRFNNITSHLRADMSGSNINGNYNLAAYEIDTRWNCMYKGIVYTVPDVIPGSDFITGTNGGTEVKERGALISKLRGTNVDYFFGMRPINISGSYGELTTFGDWNWASGTITSTDTPSWGGITDIDTGIANYHLFQTGTSTGSQLELCLWTRRANPSAPGYVMGWMTAEDTSLYVTPPGIYSSIPGLIGAWSAKGLTGVENSRISSLPIFESGSEITDLSQNSGVGSLALKNNDGPDGGSCILMSSQQYNLQSDARDLIASNQQACVVAVLQVVTSIAKGFVNAGTISLDEHWGLNTGRIYTKFCSDTRTGQIYNNSSVLTNWHIAVIRRDGSDLSVWVNDTKIYSATIGNFSVPYTIGALGVLESGQLNIREVAWYASAPSDSEISALISRVQARHGL